MIVPDEALAERVQTVLRRLDWMVQDPELGTSIATRS